MFVLYIIFAFLSILIVKNAIIYAVRTPFSQNSSRLLCEAISIYFKVRSAVKIFDFANGVRFL